MTYATLQQLETRFGSQLLVQLTDRAGSATGEIDADIVAQELGNTDAVINGYLAGRYRLPLEGDVPELLVDLALTIAIYKLHPFSPNEKIKDDYDGAMRTLRDIGAGHIRLQVAGIEPASSGSSGVVVTDRERPLSAETLKGFI
ncbi:DUF1320 domain-containing protein [Sphingomonas sp.]|uniref:gp436 family protein n=1 Tax=Sphingomonas sp. TaxID=28214 RepID=UPI00307DE91E